MKQPETYDELIEALNKRELIEYAEIAGQYKRTTQIGHFLLEIVRTKPTPNVETVMGGFFDVVQTIRLELETRAAMLEVESKFNALKGHDTLNPKTIKRLTKDQLADIAELNGEAMAINALINALRFLLDEPETLTLQMALVGLQVHIETQISELEHRSKLLGITTRGIHPLNQLNH